MEIANIALIQVRKIKMKKIEQGNFLKLCSNMWSLQSV